MSSNNYKTCWQIHQIRVADFFISIRISTPSVDLQMSNGTGTYRDYAHISTQQNLSRNLAQVNTIWIMAEQLL